MRDACFCPTLRDFFRVALTISIPEPDLEYSDIQIPSTGVALQLIEDETEVDGRLPVLRRLNDFPRAGNQGYLSQRHLPHGRPDQRAIVAERRGVEHYC